MEVCRVVGEVVVVMVHFRVVMVVVVCDGAVERVMLRWRIAWLYLLRWYRGWLCGVFRLDVLVPSQQIQPYSRLFLK